MFLYESLVSVSRSGQRWLRHRAARPSSRRVKWHLNLSSRDWYRGGKQYSKDRGEVSVRIDKDEKKRHDTTRPGTKKGFPVSWQLHSKVRGISCTRSIQAGNSEHVNLGKSCEWPSTVISSLPEPFSQCFRAMQTSVFVTRRRKTLSRFAEPTTQPVHRRVLNELGNPPSCAVNNFSSVSPSRILSRRRHSLPPCTFRSRNAPIKRNRRCCRWKNIRICKRAFSNRFGNETRNDRSTSLLVKKKKDICLPPGSLISQDITGFQMSSVFASLENRNSGHWPV